MPAIAKFDLLDVVTGQRYSLDSFGNKDRATRHVYLALSLCRTREQNLPDWDMIIRRQIWGSSLSAVMMPRTIPDDAPPKLKEMAVRLGFTFPFCHDETQRSRRPIARPAPQSSIFIEIVIWPTMDSSMTAAPVTTSRSYRSRSPYSHPSRAQW